MGRRSAPRLGALLRERGCEVEVSWTTRPGDALDAAAHADADEGSAGLCVGGDGTLNEIVNGLGDKGIPVTLFPAGTGNVLAKEYAIPCNVRRFCDMVLRGRTEMLDVAAIGERRFILFAGAGFDAAVSRSIYQRRTRRFCMLGYVTHILKILATYRFPQMEVTVDGSPAGTATGVLVTNMHSYGGPFEFVGQASPTDGLLDVCLMRGSSRRDLLRYMWGGLRHRILEYADTTHLRGKVIELRCTEGAPLQVDGDFAGTLPAKIELLNVRVPVIVP